MVNTSETPKKKFLFLKITSVVVVVFIIAGIFIYINFNRLLSEALIKNFNSSTYSHVYELKFEDLSVNLALGNIKVYNVEFRPRKKPLHNYPYINSWLTLKTDKLLLENVEIFTLLKSNKLKLEKVEITEPSVDLNITSNNPILFPFKDTTTVKDKKSIESFSLKQFKLINAALHVTNSAKQREFKVKKLNISLNDLLIDQHPGKDVISYSQIDFSIGEAIGKIKKEPIKYVGFKDFKFVIDSLKVQKSVDTLIYHFADLKTGIKELDVQTADSIFNLKLGSFDLSYKNKSIKLKDLSFKPNISKAEMQKRFKYQNTQFAATVGSLSINNLDFDSLLYHGKIFIDEVVLDKVNAEIFKDNTKPIDKSRIPTYFGEQINAVKVPLLVKQVKVTNIHLINIERKPDGSYGKANINRGNAIVKNITNLDRNKILSMNADAYIENKAHAVLSLGFSYQRPEFSINGKVDKFRFADLNKLLQSYVPAKIQNGIVDEIAFSGMVYKTHSVGTMKFLYHDLKVDLKLKNKEKWKNDVITFAANTALPAANPISKGQPARIVKFRAERNMYKGFFNIIIKSVLSGLKETMIMSKENKETHKIKIKGFQQKK